MVEMSLFVFFLVRNTFKIQKIALKGADFYIWVLFLITAVKLILDGDKCFLTKNKYNLFFPTSTSKRIAQAEKTPGSASLPTAYGPLFVVALAHLFSNAPPSALQSKCSLDGLDSKEMQPPLPPKADKYSQLKAPQTSSEGKNIPPQALSVTIHPIHPFSATKWQVSKLCPSSREGSN